MSRSKTITAVDMFCGAGGTSTGLALACREAGLPVKLLAINHWNIAIETHTAAHPWAEHMCASLDHVRPVEAIPSGRLHLLVASPECTHHARARGGRPMNDQSRATAWHIAKWAQELYIDNILIENVKEFVEWGPLGANGKPLKSRKGETFQSFLGVLRSLGYNVEYRIMNAADYGDPTTRERLFIQARRGKKPILWPAPTHSANGASTLFGKTRKYRTAREVIDWKLKNPSIFSRKKPLADATMARILAGLKKFNPQLEPFIVTLRNHVTARSMDEPVPTVTGGGTHLGLCEPFVIGQQSGATPRSVDNPLPTIATAGAIAMVEPYLVEYRGNHKGRKDGDRRVRSVEEPLATQDCSNRFALAEPFIVQVTHGEGDSGRPQTVDKPLPTITTKNGFGMVESFIIGHPHGDKTSIDSVDDPLRTVTATSSDMSLVEPFIVPIDQQSSGEAGTTSVDEPLSTIVTKARHCLAEPFLTKFYGTAKANSVDEPLATITTKDRFGLVMPVVDGKALDIRFRMLQPHELARAQGFPDGYAFQGNKSEIVKQIGNAVPVNLARALCSALIEDYKPKPKLHMLHTASAAD